MTRRAGDLEHRGGYMKRRLASMVRMRAPWRRAVLLASLVVAAAFAASPSLAGSVHVWRVGTYRGISGQFQTIQAAVDAARPGDWILVAPGDYHENGSSDPELPAGVLIRTPGIHLRGLDRNSVIVDGTRVGARTPCSSDPAFQVTGRDGIEVYKASGTYVENLTVCNFLTDPATGGHGNQMWWNGGDGSGQIGMHSYWGNYLTASSGYSNGANHPRGEYGIFVSNADGPGSINYSYASNMGDAAFYVGACPNCNALLNHDHAQYSALAYSGTNSGGNLIIENSEFDHNKTGLVSNSQNNDDLPSPQIGLCPAGSSPAVPGAVGCTIFMNNYLTITTTPTCPAAARGSRDRPRSAPAWCWRVPSTSRSTATGSSTTAPGGSWSPTCPTRRRHPRARIARAGCITTPTPRPATTKPSATTSGITSSRTTGSSATPPTGTSVSPPRFTTRATASTRTPTRPA